MPNLLNSIKLTKPKNNVFDLSHDVKLSLNMGDLVPTMCMECVPGDKFNLTCESLLRFAPLTAPIMHRVDVYMHYFFVPNRILWPNWENYITNTKVAGSLPAFPTFNYGIFVDRVKLLDYLGLPNPGETPAERFPEMSAIPLAAYQRIWYDYYRDQNLQTDVTRADIDLVDGHNTSDNLFPLRKRAWEHDYFTAALPFAQKGDPVSLPIGDVYANDNGNSGLIRNPDGTPHANIDLQSNDEAELSSSNAGTGNSLVYDPNGTLSVGSTTINDLRTAYRLQEWLEKAARAGSRYVENILAFFGVRSPDARLQRPEYITGIKSPVVISEVLNTTGTADAAQGAMAGHGASVASGKYGTYYCQEHGYIMAIMSVMPKTAYQQGIPKHFLKVNDPFELFWPQFANLGEQAITLDELYAYSDHGDETFGYIPRYTEYKFMNNRVSGDFRNTLSFWHMGRIFENEPALNEDFIKSDPTLRIFADEDDSVDHLWAHVLHKIRAVRPMPKFGTPHF